MPPSKIYIVYYRLPNNKFSLFGFSFNFESVVSFARRNGASVFTYDLTNKNAIPNL